MERLPKKVSSSQSAPDLKYFDQHSWLKTPTESKGCVTKPFKLPAHLESSSTETWLCRKWKRNAKSSCEEKCGKAAPLEIENICDYLDKKIWLKSSAMNDNQQMEVCKANEPCQELDNCLSTPHCFYSVQEGVFSNLDRNKWLLNGGKNVKPTTVHSKMFEQFRVPTSNDEVNMWLKGGNIQQRNLEDWKTKPIQLDEKVWVKRDSSGVLPDSTTPFISSASWDKVVTFHKQFGNDQWLLKESCQPEKHEIEDHTWILKSSHTSSEKVSENDQWIFANKDEDMEILQ